MANPHHLEIVRAGVDALAIWQRENEGITLDLSECSLTGLRLEGVNLNYVSLHNSDLSGADLNSAKIFHADLTGAILDAASFESARLYCTDLSGATIRRANFRYADFSVVGAQNVDLTGSDFYRASLSEVGMQSSSLVGISFSAAMLSEVDFSGSILESADFTHAGIVGVTFRDCHLNSARFGWTQFSWSDFSGAKSLESAVHEGPSELSQGTLLEAEGLLPKAFMRGCGLTDWEILCSMLYDTGLTAIQVADLLNEGFLTRSKSLFKKRVFISYASEDHEFAKHLSDRLADDGFLTWYDRESTVAGLLEKQIGNAIRSHDIVLLVLSENAVRSDWVENELELALLRERETAQKVLCSVSLDESWRNTLQPGFESRRLWRKLAQMSIIDFSKWNDESEFSRSFSRLARGLMLNYEPEAGRGGDT